ncbi:hypothetical protein D1647_11325 [Alistipes sp. Z76]|nr:hypothetical protein [Alistipes sp. Z76]NCE68809.1 hypothetical protein [Muribaculaceae bacterium M3]
MNIEECKFVDGEVYLFHPADPSCPSEDSLWGMFDKREDGEILLESMTCDLRRFVMRQPLPAVYRYCRLATRKELVDYMTDIAFASVGV